MIFFMNRHPHFVDHDLAAMTPGAAADGLLAGFTQRALPKGYLLSTPDSPHNQVLLVGSGRLRVYLAGDNRELNLSFLEAGDIYTTHTPTYVEAVVASRIWLIDTPAFARKLATDPTVTSGMMRVMGRLLNNAVGLIEDLAFREVPVRLARFIWQLAERRGHRLEHGWLVPLEFSMQDIANLLGTTRQTVSSLINQWEREGILQRQSRRSLLVPALDRLKARCTSQA